MSDKRSVSELKPLFLGIWEVEGDRVEVFDTGTGIAARNPVTGERVNVGWVLAAGRKISEPEGTETPSTPSA